MAVFLGPIARLDVCLDDEIDLVLVDLVSGTARDIIAGQEVANCVLAEAIRIYS